MVGSANIISGSLTYTGLYIKERLSGQQALSGVAPQALLSTPASPRPHILCLAHMPSRRSGGRPKQDQLVFGIWSKYYTTYTTSPVAVHSGRRTAQPGALVKTVPCPGGDASFAACSSPGAAR